MDFLPSPEQDELSASARAYLADRFPLRRVAELADSIVGWDPASWHELAELGWLGVRVSEDIGGVGLGFVEQALLLEQLGYALYPGPYFATVILALPGLSNDEQAEVAAGDARWSAEVDGLVPDLALVDRVLTLGGVARAEGDTVDTIDPTRKMGRLAPVPRAAAWGSVSRTLIYAGLAAEAVGVAQRALDIGVEHARSREQFGRAIGGYQAISHPLADTYGDVELARSLAYWAAWCIDEDPRQASVAACAASAAGATAAITACERAIQVLGGTGFTWEHPIHRFYKRALWLQAFGGYPAQQRAVVTGSLIPVSRP